VINVGIIGGETEAAGELIRILINHPDVILRAVCSPEHAGQRIDRFHRGLTGDTDLCFVKSLDPSKLNCVFLVGESWQAEEFISSTATPANRSEAGDDDSEEALRIIDMTGSFLGGEHGMVYGFPEHHRKALVRGAFRTSIPSAIATGVELALFPLAKNHLLNGAIKATVKLSRKSISPGSRNDGASHPGMSSTTDFTESQLSTRLDPVAPAEHRPDTERAAAEIEREIKDTDPSFSGNISLRLATDTSRLRGMTVTVDVPCGVNVEEVRHLYEEAYHDHAFANLIDRNPETADISNTNKCLINIVRADGDIEPAGVSGIRITAAIDDFIKGSAGTAVHCMNLLFGLSERTGLALKASVI